MFRLTYAMELLMEHAWLYQVLSDRDWSGRHRIQTSESVNSICLLKSALDIAFNDEGKQILPVPARISGQVFAARAGDNEIDVAFVHDGIPAQPSFQTVTVARCSATSHPV